MKEVKRGPTTKAISRKGMRTILTDVCMGLIDHPVTAKHNTIGSRYRMADSMEDVIKEILNKQFGPKKK
jgi:hypothetical protein